MDKYQLSILGRSREWNRSLIRYTLIIWLISMYLMRDMDFLYGIDSIFLYILLLTGYIGSFDRNIVITGHSDNWIVNTYFSYSLLHIQRSEITIDEIHVDIIVSSVRPKATAGILIFDGEQKIIGLKINNSSVSDIREELDIFGIDNSLVSYYTGVRK